jgi:hypothetical protein
MSERVTYCDRLAELFTSRPGEWIDGMELARTAGIYAWRSRASDIRRRGMTIENRQRREGQRTVSEYRYVPLVDVGMLF